MKQCEEFELAISCFVDRALSSSEMPRLFNHVAGCDGCIEFLQQVIRIRVEAGKERQYQLTEEPESKHAYVHDKPAVQRMRGRRVFALMRRRVSISVPIASVVAILLVVGTLVLSSLASRMNEPQTVYVTTLPGIEVEARNP